MPSHKFPSQSPLLVPNRSITARCRRDFDQPYLLRDCNAFLTECSDLSEASASAIGPVTSGFTETTLDFGSVNHTFAAGRRLVLLIFSEGGQTLHVGYDANDTPSSLTLQIQS